MKIKLKIGTIDGKEHEVLYPVKENERIENVLSEIYSLDKNVKITTFNTCDDKTEWIAIESTKISYILYEKQ